MLPVLLWMEVSQFTDGIHFVDCLLVIYDEGRGFEVTEG